MRNFLTFTNLYPNAVRPQHGVFVEHRLRRVLADGKLTARVVAPVPWFPFRSQRFGEWAAHARVPARETRHGIEIEHPRWLSIPKVGMARAPRSLARACLPVLQRIRSSGFDFELIDAHYFYPDGVAAIELGERLGRPVVITARGSDVNLIPTISAKAHAAIKDAALRAHAIVAVSDALRDALLRLGAPPQNVHVIRNGVDRELFRPPADARDAGPPRLLSVGNLVPNKGHHLVLDALRELPDCHLTIAGRGPMHDELLARAAQLGLTARVTMLGSVDQTQLCAAYGTADVLVLASAMEGLPNVVLEALACGTPVVATRVGGIPEVVRDEGAGALLESRTAPAIVDAVRRVLARALPRPAVRATTDTFDWSECAARVRELFAAVTGTSGTQ